MIHCVKSHLQHLSDQLFLFSLGYLLSHIIAWRPSKQHNQSKQEISEQMMGQDSCNHGRDGNQFQNIDSSKIPRSVYDAYSEKQVLAGQRVEEEKKGQVYFPVDFTPMKAQKNAPFVYAASQKTLPNLSSYITTLKETDEAVHRSSVIAFFLFLFLQ